MSAVRILRRPALAACLFFSAWCALGARPARLAGPPGTPEEKATVLSHEQMIETVREAAGLCLQLGWGDGQLTALLAENPRLLVHVLDNDPDRVETARESLRQAGHYGQVTVDLWSAVLLPHADKLVNLAVVESAGGIPEAEIRRVLAPLGQALHRSGSQWRRQRQPWPADFDQWTHARHGADGNMVSRDRAVSIPTGLRWITGPTQDSGGRKWYNDHALVSALGRNFELTADGLMARDAFNGLLLWQRKVKPCTYRERGTEVPLFLQTKAKTAVRTARVKPVAAGDRLYLAAEGKLMAWDAATGETVAELAILTNPRELLVEGHLLVVADEGVVSAYDLGSHQAVWHFPVVADHIVAGEGRVYCVGKGVLVAVDLENGRRRWWTDKLPGGADLTCTQHDGVVVLERSSWRDDPEGCELLVFAADTGRLLWWSDHRPGMTHWQETRALFAGGLLWLQSQKGQIIGLDPISGKQRKRWNSRGLHCASPVATERFFLAPECDFTDLATGSRSQARMFKSACRLPFVPANGLLNTFPVQCECYPMLRGRMGLCATVTSRPVHSLRLEKGPAYSPSAPAPPPPADPAEWPIYRHDVFRSGSTPAALPSAPPSCLWTSRVARVPTTPLAADWALNPFVPGVVTAPVAAQGMVVLAVPDEHGVVALDAQRGQTLWRFTAGGRVDTPPTLHDGLCLFGAHDGWIYCLEARSGRLVWRFRIAPQETRIIAYGQLESPWPAVGSVLIEGGLAYGVAGRHPRCDDGIHVVALKPRTGELVWEKIVNDLNLENWYSPMITPNKKLGLDFEPFDLLVKDGRSLAMSRWSLDPASGRSTLNHKSTNYLAGALAVPRGLWGYGIRQTKPVLSKPPAVFDASQVYWGSTNETALLLAGGRMARAWMTGALDLGGHRAQLSAPVVRDGLIAAGSRVYAVTADGSVVCFQ